MVPCILKYDGEVDRYIGDAILAKFGANERHPDHARRAVFAMIEMIETCDALDEELRAEGQPIIRMGAGATTGPAILGNLGTPEHMEHTIISGAAIVASRAQDLTKEFGWDILISEATYEQAKDSIEVGEPWSIEPVTGLTELRQRYESLARIYPVLGRKGDVSPGRRQAYDALRREGRSIYADFYESPPT